MNYEKFELEIDNCRAGPGQNRRDDTNELLLRLWPDEGMVGNRKTGHLRRLEQSVRYKCALAYHTWIHFRFVGGTIRRTLLRA